MKVMLLGAGYGTRLKPLTCYKPKPCLPLLNRPIVSYTLEMLARQGFKEVLINTHHLAKELQQILGDGSRWGVNLKFSYEKEILGTAGGIKKAASFFEAVAPQVMKEPFAVINSDIIVEIDLKAVLDYHLNMKSMATLVLRKDPKAASYGIISTDQNGALVRFLDYKKKETFEDQSNPDFSDYMFTGIQILDPAVLERIQLDQKLETTRDLYPQMFLENLPMYGYIHKGFWMELGDLKNYFKAHKIMIDRFNLEKKVLIDQEAEISPDSRIGPYVVIGKNCQVFSGCELEHCILLEGCRIQKNCRLKKSLIGPQVTIPENSNLNGILLYPDKEPMDIFSS